MKTFSYRMLSASELELNITGVIGDGWDENAVTAKAVRKALSDNKNAKRIVVNIDSSGGSFFDGLAIYQMLQEHPAQVDVVIGARSASAATVAQMAGDTITMHETSTMLVHPVWTVAIGNAEELRKAADDLDMLTESAVKAYAARTGMDADAVRALMSEDRYMSAEEALSLGFCTEIRKAKTKPSAMSEQEVRSEISTMRTKATASAAALRVAAMAPPQPTISTPAQALAETEKKTDMAQLAVVLAALCLAEGATDSDVLTAITQLKASADAGNKLVAALGVKSADEALGTVAALQANLSQVDSAGHTKVLAALDAKDSDEALGKIGALIGARERLASAEAKLDALGKQAEQTERDEIVAKLEADGKCTPKQVAELFPNLNLAGLKAFAATAVPILKGDGKREAKNGAQKSYAEMSNTERAELHASDPELFKQLRAEAQANGSL